MNKPDTPEQKKMDHIKPALYSYFFHDLKEVAKEHGWNLVIHGSLHRDLDLIMIPWRETVTNHESVIKIFAQIIGGRFVVQSEDQIKCFPHGRLSYVINVNRGEFTKHDPQFYIDISVIPPYELPTEEIENILIEYEQAASAAEVHGYPKYMEVVKAYTKAITNLLKGER